MQEILVSSTAVGIILGPFLDVTDGITPETGIDVATADSAVLYKHAVSVSVSLADATLTHIASGYYALMATTTMFNTLGRVDVHVHDLSVCLPVWKEMMVVSKPYWDWKYGTTKPDMGTVTAVTGNVGGNLVGTAASVSSSVRVLLTTTIASVSNSVHVGGGWIASVSNSVTLGTGIFDVGTVTGGVTKDITGSVSSITNFNKTLDVGTVTSVTNFTHDVGTVTGAVQKDIAGSITSVTNFTHLFDVGTVTGGVTKDITGSVSSITNFVHDVGTVTGAVTKDIAGSITSVTNFTHDVGTVTGAVTKDIAGSVTSITNFTHTVASVSSSVYVAGSIRKNEALSDLEFLMVDSTDHRTPKTGLTISGYRSLDGAAFGAVAGSIASVGNGIYQFDASSADTNGSLITYRYNATGADDTYVTIKTVTW